MIVTREELLLATQMDYPQYCKYLQNKYGLPPYDYMNANYGKNRKISRSEEGLHIHHVFGDRAIGLSKTESARQYPIEYQKTSNLCYCDYLEHMLLHMLIDINPDPDNELPVNGVDTVLKEFIPRLNDFYSGYKTQWKWLNRLVARIIGQKDIYVDLVCWLVSFYPNNQWGADLFRVKKDGKLVDVNSEIKLHSILEDVLTSYNAKKDLWDETKNAALYKEIREHSTTLAGGCECPVGFVDSDMTICSQCLNPVCRND